MRPATAAATVASILAVTAAVSQRTRPAPAAPANPASIGKVRIGVYDSRAIAVAWASSKYNPVARKRAELEAAKKAGDRRKIQELEAWGPAHQRLLHFQGFGRVPVTDLLAPVKPGVARVAREKGLAAVTMAADYAAPHVQVIDVTDALVELYNPTDRTRATVKALRKVEPIGLLELADMKETE